LVLGDSNLLVHLTNSASQEHLVAGQAVIALEDRGAELLYTSQNLAEFWNVCTRDGPSGLGLTTEETAGRVAMIEVQFGFMPETAAAEWIFKELLIRYRVRGVQVHDARLAALMIVNGVQEILTFDRKDFRRYAEITVLHPADFANLG
jgi:predicted nucleic acid-binding protein